MGLINQTRSRNTLQDALTFKLSIRMRKKGDLIHFKQNIVVGGRQVGLIVSETVNLLGLGHTTISRVYRECAK